ncbi:MAG: hypothetical protein WBO00_08490 [Steroidobacteraceae bacterium]
MDKDIGAIVPEANYVPAHGWPLILCITLLSTKARSPASPMQAPIPADSVKNQPLAAVFMRASKLLPDRRAGC